MTKIRKICDVSSNPENSTPFHRLFLQMSDKKKRMRRKKGEIEKDNETNQKQENNDDTETERA